MRIVTANICDNPDLPDPKMRADISEVAHLGEVIFFQEIGDATDHAAVTNTFPGTRYDVRLNNIECPIVTSRHYLEVLSSGSKMTHHGKAGVTPNRYYSWVLAKPVHRPRLHPVALMNTHFISGAYTDKNKSDKEWRAEMWQLHWRDMARKVNEFIDLDYTVIFGGDFNRLHVPKFRATQRWLVNSGIDKIGVIEAPRGTRVSLLESSQAAVRSVDLNSDHNAKIAAIRLKKPQ